LLAASIVSLVGAGSVRTEGTTIQIQFLLNGTAVTARLEDNPATRDFVAMLPMTVTLEDYASTEKIAYLPGKLSTQGAPEGIDPEKGDVTYYAPRGNLALFQKDFRYSSGLLRLGQIESGFEELLKPGAAQITIELKGN
jgi:hypothetical protein